MKPVLPYYYQESCMECNGRGRLLHDVSPTSAIYGETYMCKSCNGLGVANRITDEFENAVAQDERYPKMSALIRYLRQLYSINDLYEFRLPAYKGIVKLNVFYMTYFVNEYLVIDSHYNFQFLKKNGEWDVNSTLDNDLYDTKVIALDDIVSVSTISSEIKYLDNMTLQSKSRIVINVSTGESIEFDANGGSASALEGFINEARREMAQVSP